MSKPLNNTDLSNSSGIPTSPNDVKVTLNHLPSKGVVHLSQSQKHYCLKHANPHPSLTPFVEQYWQVSWDLRGKPAHKQHNLPHPCIHITFENKDSTVYGPIKQGFKRSLSGQGTIFGIKFKTGGFYPINQSRAVTLTDTTLSLQQLYKAQDLIMPETYGHTVSAILQSDDFGERCGFAGLLLDSMLAPYLGIQDIRQSKILNQINQVNNILTRIENDQTITKVQHICECFGLSTRSLQRLFNTYVGVSPKWLIRKFRLHNILDRLEQQTHNQRKIDWQQYVADLGYADQAHFINDFKTFIGCTPERYITRNKT